MTSGNNTPIPDPHETKFEENGASQCSADAPAPRMRWLWIFMSVAVLAAVIYSLGYLEDTADVSQKTTDSPLPLVSVENIKITPQQAIVSSFAEIRPRWSAELTVSVAGRIEQVFEAALAGEPVEAGIQLIKIENSRYAAELAAAKQAEKEAKLNLWQAENATLLARGEYKRNNSTPPNDLALKLPQLEIAKSAVVSAKARVKAAQQQLNDTLITAPFAAYVTDRFVSPGQSVSPGDRLLKLVDKSSFELVTEIGREDWALINKPLEGQIARLLDQDGEEIATARVRRGGGFLNEKTRQYRLFLQTDSPGADHLLPGDFVTVQLDGITIEDAFNIPSSALTREGFVWIVDDTDELTRIEPDLLFRRDNRVIVRAPEGLNEWRVVVTPLVSFLPGRKVSPRLMEN